MNVFMLVSNCMLLACSGFGFIYGAMKYFRARQPLFPTLVTCGIGCLMLCHLFLIVTLFTDGEITPGFNVGKLGLIGGFLFFFSASYGQMDGLVDNRSKEFLKYRLIALAAPLVILGIGALSFSFPLPLSALITNSVVCVIIAMSAYYNFKHIFIPDVDMGILKCIRSYNSLALALMLLSVLQLFAADLNFEIATIVVSIAISAVYVLILPLLGRGMKKWTI